jgi:hypothetical protein
MLPLLFLPHLRRLPCRQPLCYKLAHRRRRRRRVHAGGGSKHASLDGLREGRAPCLFTAGMVGPLPPWTARGKGGPHASLPRERRAPCLLSGFAGRVPHQSRRTIERAHVLEGKPCDAQHTTSIGPCGQTSGDEWGRSDGHGMLPAACATGECHGSGGRGWYGCVVVVSGGIPLGARGHGVPSHTSCLASPRALQACSCGESGKIAL